jgi:glucosamine-6-phosphate deaminase
MARELVDAVKTGNAEGRVTRAILPCGPTCWYEPFCRTVNTERVRLGNLVVFHMDECLDWQGRLLPKGHPYNFRAFMEEHFYAPVDAELRTPEGSRVWLTPARIGEMKDRIAEAPVDITLGGWGQDGHVAYNQARRNPYSQLTLDQLRSSSIRVQDNNPDTVIALAQRTFGSAYQLVPPMSVTLGVAECLSAKKVRVFSDTGAWKQTALRVALFSPPTVEYPMTLLSEHPDAMLTATRETAEHPVAQHPEWDFTGESGYFEE